MGGGENKEKMNKIHSAIPFKAILKLKICSLHFFDQSRIVYYMDNIRNNSMIYSMVTPIVFPVSTL